MWQKTLNWLQARRTTEGAWGYLVDQPPNGEPTLLSLAAGAQGELAWLDGAALGWSVLMAPSCLSQCAPERVAAAAQASVTLKGDPGGLSAGSYDASIQGWAWVDGTFSWVEPSAWAVLGLRSAGLGGHPRCVEGLRLLRDRQCSDGGWNSGNPDVLGTDLPGYLYLAGLCALALPGGPEVERALDFAEGVRDNPSVMNLSYAILARLRHGRDPAPELAMLRQRQSQDGSFSARIDRNALAALALRAAAEGRSPLHV